jgi:hypothetical protein
MLMGGPALRVRPHIDSKSHRLRHSVRLREPSAASCNGVGEGQNSRALFPVKGVRLSEQTDVASRFGEGQPASCDRIYFTMGQASAPIDGRRLLNGDVADT